MASHREELNKRQQSPSLVAASIRLSLATTPGPCDAAGGVGQPCARCCGRALLGVNVVDPIAYLT